MSLLCVQFISNTEKIQTETTENLKFYPMLKQSLWALLLTALGLPSEGQHYQTVNSDLWVEIPLLRLLNSGVPNSI